MNPNVSVILPTYNRRGSLRSAMQSVLTQSYEDLELIVVDDASSEDVEGLVRSVADQRVRYVRRITNGGAAAARNTGLAHARGRFIAFQDSDDLWLPGKLQRQVQMLSLQRANVGVVAGAKILYGRDSSFRYGPAKVAYAPAPEGRLQLEEDQLGRLLNENRLSVQTALFRKDCYPNLPWFDECAKANEDWEFAIRLCQHTVIYEDAEPVIVGFVSADSISSSCRKQTIGLLRVLKANRDLLGVRKTERALMMLDVGRSLMITGKRRLALRFILSALGDAPLTAGRLVPGLTKRMSKAIGSLLIWAQKPPSTRRAA